MFLRPLLLALALQPLGAQILVEPAHGILQAGQTQTFTAQTPEGAPVACAWTVTGPGGTIGADGTFRGAPGLHRVRGTSLRDASLSGETRVLVLEDHAGLRTVGKVDPEALRPGWSEALPFLDLTTGKRLGDPGARVIALKGAAFPQREIIGYGLAASVTWPAPGLVPDAVLMSWTEGSEPVRKDVTGSHGAVFRARAGITGAQVEFLNQASPRDWTSLVQPLAITVRGVLPFAGNPLGPGDADGRGLSARFRRAEGLAFLADGTLVVSDSQARALRLVDPTGSVRTLPDIPLVSPSFVAVLGGAILVADAGAHVIRRVDAKGAATVLAGVPGLRGHRDAPVGAEALFDDPQGLAVDGAGNVYVADWGNHVIRKIGPQGAVTTVAGLPGAAGTQDGPQGTFSALMGLAWQAPATLFAVDGHSVRRVAGGCVTTVYGDPALPGAFPRIPVDVGIDGRRPCLDRPHSVVALGTDLYVTETGGRTLQAIHLRQDGRVKPWIVAGDPEQAGTRFGLFRMGIKAPLGEGFAALAEPRGLAMDGKGDLFLADGTCVVHGSAPGSSGPRLTPVPFLATWDSAVGLPLTVDIDAPPHAAHPPHWDLAAPIHYHWTLDALDPEGRPLIPRVRGEQRGGRGARAELVFRKPGKVNLQVTVITEDGIPAQGSLSVTVR